MNTKNYGAQPTSGGASPDLTTDGRLAVISSGIAGVTVYDVATLAPIGDPFPFAAEVRQGSLAADAAVLATATEAGAVLWDLDVDTWPEIACRAAGRTMSSVEYDQFGLGAGPDRACSGT